MSDDEPTVVVSEAKLADLVGKVVAANMRVEELEAALRGWVEARDAYNAIDTSSIDHMIEEVKVAVPRLKEAEARARAVLKGVSQ